MKKIVSINVRSVFRIALVLGAVAGLLIGLVVMAEDFFVEHLYTDGIIAFLITPLLYSVLGAIVNAFMAWVYNAVAARLGGIEVELED